MLDAKCELLRSLHVPGTPLVLANAWDAASARAVVAAGFPVVATTSGGVAASIGFGDEEDAPPDEMWAAAARIVRSVEVPVTVDAESGYGLPAGELIHALLDAGAAGCNLEDTDHSTGLLTPSASHAERLGTVRAAADEHGYGLVINARIDVFLSETDERPLTERLDETIERGKAYRAAGADCLYPILLADEEAIARFVKAVEVPVNVLAMPPGPSLAELAGLGVARVSFGTSLHQQTFEGFTARLESIRRS
jgi:2-methylisocitrate lyase-like PEP mutase family enzyme